jgi:hypothetical protein
VFGDFYAQASTLYLKRAAQPTLVALADALAPKVFKLSRGGL